jgi:hypothetical protein
MQKPALILFSFLLTAATFALAGGQTVQSQEKKPAEAKESQGPPPYTYTGKFYGFVTSSNELKRGYKITPEEVKKSVAEGGRYVLFNNFAGRLDLEPQEKAAPFAGQQVWLQGSITTQKYGTGPTSDPSIEGYYAGGDRPATRFEGVKIISITPTKRDDAWANFDSSTELR